MTSYIDKLETIVNIDSIKTYIGLKHYIEKFNDISDEEKNLLQIFYNIAKFEFDKYCIFVNTHKKELINDLGDKIGKCSEYDSYISPLFYTVHRYSPFTDIIFRFIIETDTITEEDLKSRYSFLIYMFRGDNLKRYMDYTDEVIEYNFKHFSDEKYNDINNRGPLHYLCMFLSKPYKIDEYYKDLQLNTTAKKLDIHNKLIEYYINNKPNELIRYDNFHHIPFYYCYQYIDLILYYDKKIYNSLNYNIIYYINVFEYHPTALNKFMDKLLINKDIKDFIGINPLKYYLIYHNEDENNEELLNIIRQLGYSNVHDYLQYNQYIIYYDVDHSS